MIDVLVVGAGPVGLLMAAELARHGLAPRLIERRAERSTLSKALAIHARTLEILHDVGVVDEVLARGLRVHGVNVYANRERIAHLSFDELQAPYPFILSLPQSDTEELLEGLAGRHGVEVEREAELIGVVQDTQGVTATLRRGGEEESCRARWLVACDGAHSTVRRALGLAYGGEDLEATFALADVHLAWDRPHDESHVFFSPEGPVIAIPMPGEGRYRLVAAVPADGGEATLAGFEALLAERCHLPVTASDPRWLTTFAIRQRKVDRYRDGRVFVAGDAAHCHSPAGGQGMNTGLQDAYNLAWKLALVARGVGRPELLDSYHAEREPIAAQVLRGTGVGTKVVTLRHPVTRAVRNHIASFLTSLEVVQQRALRATGELDVGYRGSPIVTEDRGSILGTRLGEDRTTEAPSLWDFRDFGAGPRAGDRAPDADLGGARLHDRLRGTAHTLLLFDGQAPTEHGYVRMAAIADRVRARHEAHVSAHVVIPGAERPATLAGWDGSVLRDVDGAAHAAYGASAECLYLVRPDGHVGYRAQPIDEDRLRAALGGVFV